VDRVLIDDNQHVKKGDLLVTIDPRDYDAALRQKQASLDSFKAQAAAVEATIEQQQAHLNTLQSTQESDQATAEADRGISLITTFVTRGTQAHQALMVGHLVPHNHVYLDRLSQMGTIVAPHSGAVMAQSQGYGLMYGTLQQQAALWSYIDQFRLLAIVSLLLAPIIFLYRKSPSPSK
jgi:multidrug efflux pump subunit AcrA (membrane-fusion protein)